MSSKLPFLLEGKRAVISEDELEMHCQAVRSYYLDLPFHKKQVKKGENYYRWMARFFAPLNIFKRTIVLYSGTLPFRETGIIFVSNHIGSYDQFFLTAALGPRPVHYLVNQKVTTWPIRWNLIYRPSGAIVVNQQSLQSWKNAKTELVQLLLHGHNILIFPEGTRRGADNLGEFHTGIAQVVRESGSEVVPLAIKNTARLRSSQQPIVCVGKSLLFGPRDKIKAITQRIQSAVYENYKTIQIYEHNPTENAFLLQKRF